jgi:hypothetical protein
MRAKVLVLGVLTLPLVASAAALGRAAGADPVYLKARDGRNVAAIYTPLVWNELTTAGNPGDGSGNTGPRGTGDQDIVRIAFREPGGPEVPSLAQQPWQLALVDSRRALSWAEPDAQHPIWLAAAPVVAAQSGVTDLAGFTVIGGFKREQLANRKFVMLYRIQRSGQSSHMEFAVEALPDPARLPWQR